MRAAKSYLKKGKHVDTQGDCKRMKVTVKEARSLKDELFRMRPVKNILLLVKEENTHPNIFKI
jgi:hypothetical protein